MPEGKICPCKNYSVNRNMVTLLKIGTHCAFCYEGVESFMRTYILLFRAFYSFITSTRSTVVYRS